MKSKMAAVGLSLVASVAMAGATIRVPTDQATIAEAIAAAASGDEIVLEASGSPYTLASNVTVPSGVTLRGETGDRADVVIQANERYIQLSNANTELSAVTFSGSMFGTSGVVYLNNAKALCHNCCVTNVATREWNARGAIKVANGVVSNCLIQACYATLTRPVSLGVYLSGGTVVNTVIRGNYCSKGFSGGYTDSELRGAALRLSGSSKAINCLVFENSLGSFTDDLRLPEGRCFATGVLLQGTAQLINCTVADNTYVAKDTGRVLGVAVDSANARVKNCIIVNNGNAAGDVRNIVPNGDAFVCCAVSASEAGGCTESVAATRGRDYTMNGARIYYPIKGGTICDKADVTLLPAGCTVDVYGNPRTRDGGLDIGAVEADPSVLVAGFSFDNADFRIPYSTTLTANVAGGTAPYTYGWDLDGDGEMEICGGEFAQVTLAINVTSTSNVTLTVMDDAAAAATYSQSFSVYQDTFYVSEEAKNPVAPYATWATATPNLADAMAIATEGSTVCVSNGTYALAANLTIPSQITLRGATGDRDDVTIAGGLAYRVELETYATARDVTFSKLYGGYNSVNAPVNVGADASMENCRVTACKSESIYSHGAVYNNGGLVSGCLIDANYNTETRAYATGCHQEGTTAKIENSVIRGNSMANGATATRPSSLDDLRPAAAVYLGAGNMVNCLVTGNKMNAHSDATSYTHPLATGVYGREAVKIVNTLVADNTYSGDASSRFSGIYLENGGAIVENGVLRGNGHSSGTAEANVNVSQYACYANCATDADAAANITDGVALSAVADEYEIAGDVYSLRGDSALVDAGKAQDESLVGETDAYGKSRVSGAAIDIGPSEYQYKRLDCSIQASATEALDALDAHLVAQVQGTVLTGVTYDWDLGDGQSHTASSVDVAMASPGTKTVTLTVRNDQDDEATASVTLTVHRGTWNVSTVEEIQPAIDGAVTGAQVLLAKGDYALARSLYVTNGVIVRGATGNRDDVHLKGGRPDNAKRFTMVYVRGAGSTLASVTVEDGYALYNNNDSVAGVRMGENTVVSNCCVRRCAATAYYPSGVGVRNDGGRLCDTLIEKCCAEWGRAYAVGYYQSAGTIERSQVVSNYCSSITLIYEYGIKPTVMGAWVVGGTMENCLVADNYIGSVNCANAVELGIGATFGGSAKAINSLFYHNHYAGTTTATIRGVKREGSSQLVNCALFANGKTDGSLTNNLAGSASYDHCAADDVTGCTESVATTFAAAYRADTRTGLWRLRRDSPLVDAGASQPTLEAGSDLVGNPRLFGAAIDIGPVELQGRTGLLLLVK